MWDRPLEWNDLFYENSYSFVLFGCSPFLEISIPLRREITILIPLKKKMNSYSLRNEMGFSKITYYYYYYCCCCFSANLKKKYWDFFSFFSFTQ
jgi:hypothetical protein